MNRGAWQATVHEVAGVEQGLVTKINQLSNLSYLIKE